HKCYGLEKQPFVFGGQRNDRWRPKYSARHDSSNQSQPYLEAGMHAPAVWYSPPISSHFSSARAQGLSNQICALTFALEDYVTTAAFSHQFTNGSLVQTNEDMMPKAVFDVPAYSHCDFLFEHMVWDIGATNMVMLNVAQTSTSYSRSPDMRDTANISPAGATCFSYTGDLSPGEPSGPTIPDILPVQGFDATPPQKQTKYTDKEELAGMGLYSEPNALQLQSQHGNLGQGLKLEETFILSDDEESDS
ncbi:hypothetical protein N7448_011284, partial [Penicillium atrosanguineum]